MSEGPSSGPCRGDPIRGLVARLRSSLSGGELIVASKIPSISRAAELAALLDLDWAFVATTTLSAPWSHAAVYGALAHFEAMIFHEDKVREWGIPLAIVRSDIAARRQENDELMRVLHPAGLNIGGERAIVIDDGHACGLELRAVAVGLRNAGCGTVDVVSMPGAPRLARPREVDRVLCG